MKIYFNLKACIINKIPLRLYENYALSSKNETTGYIGRHMHIPMNLYKLKPLYNFEFYSMVTES